MDSYPILESQKTRLRRLTAADVPLQFRWIYDPDVLPWLQLSEDPPEIRTLEGVRERFERMNADPWVQVWRVETLDGTPIGQIELVDIHPGQKRAEMHMLIGEPAYRSGGYGADALNRLLRYAFEELGLRRVYSVVDADNARALRAFEKAGFQREGLLRAHRLRHGQPQDMVIIGIVH